MRLTPIVFVLALAAGACSRTNLDVITSPPDAATTDAASSDRGPDRDSAAADASRSPGCTQPSTASGERTVTIQTGTTSRSYLLHVPSTYDGKKAVPLVLDFHSITVMAMTERNLSAYPAALDPEGAIIAFPNGLSGPIGPAWNVGPCCVGNVDDVGFARAVVTQIEASACIDRTRVYAVGFSMGGGMAYQLACQAADVFAGVAPSSWDLLAENSGACAPSRPITVISFRGTADTLVPYAGGASTVVSGMPITFLGAQATFARWAALDHCQDGPSTLDANGCSRYSGCSGGVVVELCIKNGGGQEMSNPAIAWPLLSAHPL